MREIYDPTDILEVIGKYVDLKKVGLQYLAICPFHRGFVPSFVVNPTNGIFHCFGCGTGGTVNQFLELFNARKH